MDDSALNLLGEKSYGVLFLDTCIIYIKTGRWERGLFTPAIVLVTSNDMLSSFLVSFILFPSC